MAETHWTNVCFPHGLVSLANGKEAVLWSQVNDVSRCRVQLLMDGRLVVGWIEANSLTDSMFEQPFTLLPFPLDGGPKRRGFTAPGQLLHDPSTGVLSGNVNDSPHPDVQILLSHRPLLQPGDLLL